ncbi:MAG: ABC transporter permease [Oscillospiraceae bacterium]|nr:ABC transporter permease [Oscillospiraceae bacterium]
MGILRLSLALTRVCLKRIVVFVCLTALLSVIAGLLGSFLLYGEGAVPPIGVALVDEDNSFESRMLTGYLTDMGQERRLIDFFEADRAGGQALLERGQVSAVILIPQEFMAGVMDGRNQPFTVTLDSASPMRAAFIRTFVGVYADMLRTGQQGVYTALDAARQYGDERATQEMFRLSNMRFLTAMLNRGSMMETETVTATGAVSAADHYTASAFVFLMLLGASLFLDVWGKACGRPIVLRLSALGAWPVKSGLGYLAGAMLPFGAACLLLFLISAAANLVFDLGLGFSVPLLAGLLMTVLVCGGFMLASAWLFGEGPGGGIFVFLYGLAGLFLSGGVLPPAYLAPAALALGRLTPHYHLSGLLSHGLSGQMNLTALAGSAAFAGIFSLAMLSGMTARAKAGGRL